MILESTIEDDKEEILSVITEGTDATAPFISMHVQPEQNRLWFLQNGLKRVSKPYVVFVRHRSVEIGITEKPEIIRAQRTFGQVDIKKG